MIVTKTKATKNSGVFRWTKITCELPFASRRMRRHIRDLNVESARNFKFNQAARWLNNKENDQKMVDNAYLFRVYVLHTCVSKWLSYGFCRWDIDGIKEMFRIVDLVVFFSCIWSISEKIFYEEIFGGRIFLLQSALLNGYHTALNVCCLRKLYAKF